VFLACVSIRVGSILPLVASFERGRRLPQRDRASAGAVNFVGTIRYDSRVELGLENWVSALSSARSQKKRN